MNASFSRLKSLEPDFYIRTKDNQSVGTHKAVLILVSEVLADLLTSGLSNKNELELSIESKDLRMILDLIYEEGLLRLNDLDQYRKLLKWLKYFLINIDVFLPLYVNLPYNLFFQLQPEDCFVDESDKMNHMSYTVSIFERLKTVIPDLQSDIGLIELYELYRDNLHLI